MNTTCPHCHRQVKVPDGPSGSVAKCPACEGPILVETQPAFAAPAQTNVGELFMAFGWIGVGLIVLFAFFVLGKTLDEPTAAGFMGVLIAQGFALLGMVALFIIRKW